MAYQFPAQISPVERVVISDRLKIPIAKNILYFMCKFITVLYQSFVKKKTNKQDLRTMFHTDPSVKPIHCLKFCVMFLSTSHKHSSVTLRTGMVKIRWVVFFQRKNREDR